jgi:hypothetical protein
MAFTGCASKSIDASCLMANVPEESLDFIANRAGEGGIAFDSGKWISELGIMSPENHVRNKAGHRRAIGRGPARVVRCRPSEVP